MPSKFPGFPKEGIAFLRALKKNNNREWFQPRKQTFDETVKAPMEELVNAFNSHLVQFAPDHVVEPKKAIYRIYRDTRFSSDKTPYKDHIAANFPRRGFEKHSCGGYYFSVGASEIEIAAGVYMPGPEQLLAIRQHIAEHHEDFRQLAEDRTLNKLMGPMWGESLTRVPKGFPAEHPAADLLKRKQWIFYTTGLDHGLATTPKLLVELVKRARAMAPFVDFLNRPLTLGRKTVSPW